MAAVGRPFSEGKLLLIAAVLIALSFGCRGDEETMVVEASSGCQSNSQATLTATAAEEVTFYQDILPFLSSQRLGESYKCTVCHQHYAEPSGVNSVKEVSAIIDSINSGRMPPKNSDRVKPHYVTLLRQWRLAGFPEGKLGAPARASNVSNVSRDTSSGCR